MPIHQQVVAQNLHNDISLGVQFGTIEYKGDLGNEFFTFDGVHPSIGLNLSKYISPSFDLMGKIKHGVIDRNSFSNSLLDLNLTLKYKFNNNYILKESTWVSPYVFFGIGDAMSFYTDKISGLKEQPLADFNFPMGGGIQFNINQNFAFTVETHYNYVINDKLDGVRKGKWDDSFLYNTIGFNFIFPSGPDNDNDGVKNKNDICPDIIGDKNSFGCPDTDNDGIIDPKDKCPNIPGSLKEKGCPDHYLLHIETMSRARNGLLFNSGSTEIQSSSYNVLDDVVTVLKGNPTYKLNIDGHTDNIGTTEHNISLSQLRANSVKTYLTNYGISPNRIIATGFGASKPISDNSTELGRTKNRRVEFNVNF